MASDRGLAARLTRLRPLSRGALAAAMGVLTGLGQAPFDLPVLGVLALAGGILVCLSGTGMRRAGRLGWFFGAGYFTLTLHWIVEPFFVDAPHDGWMAPFALVLMAGGMALFWGLAFAGAALLAGSPSLWRRGLALVVTLTLFEMTRSVIFTGFPWALLGTSWVDTPLRLLAAWVGPHGLGALTVGVAVLCAQALAERRGRIWVAVGAGGILSLAMLTGTVLDRRIPVSAPEGAPVVRLVQPNAAQDVKWLPDMIPMFWERQLALTARNADKTPDLVIWPEVSLPFLLGSNPYDMADISEAAKGAPVIVGAQRYDGDLLFNSLAVIGPGGTIGQIYDKYHLVPFGEYIPGGKFIAGLGINGLATDDLGGFDSGPGPKVLDLSRFGLGHALPLICYEAIFPGHARAPGARPDWIVQITNDAWFGNFAGPQQHLAQARMRAVEQGLPLVRAANTGISAFVDPAGRIIAALPLNTYGILDKALPAPLPPTPYARFGDLPVLLVLAVAAIGMTLLRRRRDRPESTFHHGCT